MKKFFLLLLFFVAIAANLSAQTLGIAPNGVFNEDDIEFWVGSGSNQAALVLVFNDGKFPDALVWGYRYDRNKTMQQMCQEIAEADSRFFYHEGNNGSTVNGFGVDYNENGIFALQNPNNSSIVINLSGLQSPFNAASDSSTAKIFDPDDDVLSIDQSLLLYEWEVKPYALFQRGLGLTIGTHRLRSYIGYKLSFSNDYKWESYGEGANPYEFKYNPILVGLTFFL